jgi:hypothetical protein
MKNIFRLLLVFTIVSTTSCREALDLNPIDVGAVDGFFTTTSDVVAGVNGVYQIFQGDWWGGAFVHVQPHFISCTENAVICCAWEYQYKRVAQGVMNSTTGGVLSWKWDYGFQAIFRVNSILEVLDSGVIEDMTPEDEAKIRGELLFLRAYVYAEMTHLYGDVPLVTKVLTPEEARSITRDPKATVVAQIHADLDFAASNLDTSPYLGQFGRPTRQAALALKGRTHLWNNEFAEAASVLQQVIDLEGDAVALDDDYESLFRGANEQSPEILFSLQYVDQETGAGEGSFLGAHYGPNQLDGTAAAQGQGWGAFQFTSHLVDDYYMQEDGLPIDQSTFYDPAQPFEGRDPRFKWTFFTPGSVYRGVTLDSANFNSNGTVKDIPIASKKWKTEDANNSFTNNGSADLVLMRYADVLLMFAEATNEVSGPTAAVYEAVNKIRARADMPDFPTGLSKDEMRDEIKHERKVEFVMEGTRYFDLLRWRDAETVLLQVTNEARIFDPSIHYLWPVPQFAIDQSPNLTQNPGY